MKKRICEVSIPNPQWTKENVTQFACKEFDKKIERALISKILKEGDQWTSPFKEKGKRTRIRPAQHVRLEDSVFVRFQQESG